MELSNLGKRRESTPSCIPLLVLSHGKHKNMNTICTVSKNSHQRPKYITEICGKIIWCSYLEWLVLEDAKSGEFCLFNIGTMEKVEIPKLGLSRLMYIMLSSRPDDPQCRIVCISRRDENFEFMLCKPGDDEYVIQHWQTNDDIWGATIFNGKLYCFLIPDFTLIVSDITGPSVSTAFKFKKVINEGLADPSRGEFQKRSHYLVDAGNELILVHIRYMWLPYYDQLLHFKVFRADFSNMAWVRIDSIGDRTIFLDSCQSACRSAAEAGTQRNCIYYSTSDDRKLYIFNLEFRSLTTFLPSEIVSKKEVECAFIWKHP